VAALTQLERAQADARSALTAAQVQHDAASAAMQEAEQAAIQRLASTVMGTRPAAPAITTGAARGGLRTAEDGLAAARGAKALLDDQVLDARRAVGIAEATVRAAALRVLAAEELEPLIERAVNARASYLEAVGGLGWLIRNHAMPSGDTRAQQLVLGADTPPTRWPEATPTGGGMAKRLAALMEGDHP
jgi:hypothetical protein